MRRKDRELTEKSDIETVIKSGDVCHLALNTGDAPYIVPLNYGYEWNSELKLFFHGAVEGRKIDLIAADNRAGFEIDINRELVKGPEACNWSMKYASVVGTGRIQEITDKNGKVSALNQLMKHYHFPGMPVYPDAMLKAVRIFCLEVGQITGKARR